MASIRVRTRRSGEVSYAVLYVTDGRQSSVTYEDRKDAERFKALVDTLGPERALEVDGIQDIARRDHRGLTVGDYLRQHIGSLSGVERKTITEYNRYLTNDIAPVFGLLPLPKLTRADVAGWVNAMAAAGARTGTMQNKHGFLSGALKQAVKDGQIDANPCDGVRVPRTEERATVFLTSAEFQILKAAFTEHYQPLVQFLVASGCRFNEATALRPSDLNRTDSTVRIARAWKQDGTRYTMGPPKTQKSNRTINVPKTVLDGLDYSKEWLFTTTKGEPIRLSSWRTNVWNKSRSRAQSADPQNADKAVLVKSPTPHDLRHTCASWMIQAGVPLPVIQAHLGHESIMTTVDRYGHLDRSSHVVAADAIGQALGF